MADERKRLRTTFDEAASLYDQARPGYPEDLFDDIVSLSGIPAGGRILEIGCGTGQATVPFARRGYRILCIELGENMAAVARRNLEGFMRKQKCVPEPSRSPLCRKELLIWRFRRPPSTGSILPLPIRRPPRRSEREGRSPCSGTFTSTATRAKASSRLRRESTNAKRRRSSVQKTTRGFPDPTKSLIGRERSRIQASSAVSSPAITGGMKRTIPGAICVF